ncbi:MAG: LLM class flavin-dependent oxidoreductase [Thermomicrobiales bacterium]|nr:LLM class flavin-dependent oxidoreductase [Thermomicrobiales bacterium]
MPILTFGIQTVPTKPWPEMVETWKRVEALGFDSVWLPDHFVPTFRRDLPFMEAWTLLAGLAAVTERVRLGVLVSCNTFRHPALLAKEAVTVDHVSRGRLELGIGTGWVEFEHEMFGISYPDAPKRVAMYGEAIAVIDNLLRNELTTFHGEHYRLNDAPFRPGPVQTPRPPLTLAAHSPRMLRLIAPYADRWNSMGSSEEMRERNRRLDEACNAISREPGEIVRSLLYVPMIMPDEHPWDSVDAFADYVGRFSEAGVSDFILQPPGTGDWTVVERVATDLIPKLRSRA